MVSEQKQKMEMELKLHIVQYHINTPLLLNQGKLLFQILLTQVFRLIGQLMGIQAERNITVRMLQKRQIQDG